MNKSEKKVQSIEMVIITTAYSVVYLLASTTCQVSFSWWALKEQTCNTTSSFS